MSWLSPADKARGACLLTRLVAREEVLTRHTPHPASVGHGDHRFRWSKRVVGLENLNPGPHPYQGSAPDPVPQDRPCHLGERSTARDRCEPLGSDGVWTNRGPSLARRHSGSVLSGTDASGAWSSASGGWKAARLIWWWAGTRRTDPCGFQPGEIISGRCSGPCPQADPSLRGWESIWTTSALAEPRW
jgi:hypothetical protein